MTGEETRTHRRPGVFPAGQGQAEPGPDDWGAEVPMPQVAPVRPLPVAGRGWRPLAWAFGALGLLVTFWIGYEIDALVRRVMADYPPLGYAALALSVVLIVGLLGFALREVWALRRLRRIDRLRRRAAGVLAAGRDAVAAREVAGEVRALYAGRPDAAWSSQALDDALSGLMDGDAILHEVERRVLSPLDAAAQAAIRRAAARVTAVTAIAPAVGIDTAVVLANNVRLVREIAAIYGGRPGFMASSRLVREVAISLVFAGGMSVGDDILSQIAGHGLTAKISTRLGEGLVNGALTGRVGLIAMDMCRPLPFTAVKRPRLRDLVAGLADRIGRAAPEGAAQT